MTPVDAQPGKNIAVASIPNLRDMGGWATNEQLLPALKPLIDQMTQRGVDPGLLTPVVGVQEGYLDAALDEMQQRYKTIEGYFSDGLGLESAVVDRLRPD